MRTRSPTRYLGVPPPCAPYNRCHTVPDWRRSPPKEPCRCCDDSCRCTNARNPVARRRSGSSCFFVNNATYASSGSCEALNDARLRLLVVRREVMHAVLFQQPLQRSVQKFRTLIGLQLVGLFVVTSFSNRLKAATSDAADLLFSGMHHAVRKHIDHGQQECRPVVGCFQTRHVDEIGLPLLVRTAHHDAAAFEVAPHRFVKSVRVLRRQPSFDVPFGGHYSP